MLITPPTIKDANVRTLTLQAGKGDDYLRSAYVVASLFSLKFWNTFACHYLTNSVMYFFFPNDVIILVQMS